MTPIVLQLQQDALDQSVQISNLLRKALVVAKKLKLDEFESWINAELNGYKNSDLPDYREVQGQVKGWNPYNGWIPLIFEDSKMAVAVSKSQTRQPVAELEHLVTNGSGSSLQIPLSAAAQLELSKGFGFETQVHLFISKATIVRIIEMVRTIVLNWSLRLEADGILGEGLSFNRKEQEVASKSPQIVTNFYGSVHNQQLQQGNQVAIQAGGNIDSAALQTIVRSASELLASLKGDQAAELRAEIETLEAQSKSPKPKQSILRESLSSMRTILEGAAGGAAGQLAVEIGKLLVQ